MAATQRSTGAGFASAAPFILTVPREILSELGRATTAYYEATPDKLEQAWQEYEEALRQFNAMFGLPQL